MSCTMFVKEKLGFWLEIPSVGMTKTIMKNTPGRICGSTNIETEWAEILKLPK